MTTREEGDITVVTLAGEVDVFSAPTLRDELAAVIAADHTMLLADLTDVPFLDSTGLGVLVGRLKTVRVQGGELRLVITSDRVLRNFQITGLDKVFRIYSTAQEGLADMAGER
ncbi:STAS domain-containing protein [Luteipulveratus sp. YIM 133132]|uniref:Anti-sigma factor antagonist n=1 Tax=Luteipulveratus flavus TaxID=3031728 RepID=A0ABT6C7E5_9MICO|nr:STAS domain-containing protein [Luteipulveratus sp. YIM 133296]MDE9366942.1 STAS domain-containing protein [Luteipulveratus sp. YIM 133132]MDF8264780.1 STAS domain-containing protein [Luteipulveratus sp. YIM 133296]